jgi:hypothetical protein
LADESRNPQDNYELRALKGELEGLRTEIRAEMQQLREQVAESARVQRRQAPEPPRARAGRGGRPVEGRVGTAAEEVAETRQLSTLEQELNRHRQEGVRAAERQLEVERQLTRATGERAAAGARPIGGRPSGLLAEAQAREAAARTSRFSGDLGAAVAAGAPYDDSLRRHGALTTEFFDALKSGEITFAEFRYQMGATIAKFSGWTAASVFVFGALDAVRQFGKGALDASAGASQLQRYINNVDTSKAQEQFVELAQQFNLPIADVADAFGRMGQVFHNQDQAFEATKAALYGVKVGNLDVADSTRFLLGIVRGFKLGPEELGAVFDRINQAQNKFGVGIRDTAAGVSKAAGAWRAAGGDVNTLTALIVTGAAKTGRTGEEMGTAFGRMAEIIHRGTNQNKEQLKEFGIDAAKPVDEVIRRAASLVQSGRVRGPDVTRLAAALSTPQLAGRITPILQDPAFLKRVEDTLAHSRGSAPKELEKTLRSAREQLDAIGNNLQTLGAEFVRAGGAAPFAVMLKALNLALSTGTDLLQVFNQLPGPIKTVAVSVLEIAGALKLAGRFGLGPGNLGNLLGGGRGSALERRNASRVVETARAGAARAATELADATYEQRIMARVGTIDQQDAAARRVAAAEARLTAAEEELALVTQARAGTMRRAALADELTSLPARGPRGLPLGPTLGPRGLTAAEEAAVAAQAAGQRSRLQRIGDIATRGPAANTVGALARGTQRLTDSVFRAESRMATMALLDVGAMLGPLDVVIAGFLLLPPLIGGLEDAFKKLAQRADAAGTPPPSHADREKQAKGPKPGDHGVIDFLPGYQDYLAQFGFGQSGAVEQREADSARRELETQAKLRWERYIGVTRGPAAVRRGLYPHQFNDPFGPLGPVGPQTGPMPVAPGRGPRAGGIPRPHDITISGLPTSEIRRDAANTVAAFKKGMISRGQAMELLDGSLRDIKQSSSSLAKQKLATHDIQQLRDSLGPGHGRSLKDIINALSNKEFAKRMQEDSQAIQTLGLRRRTVRDVMAGYQTALARVKRNPSPGNVARFNSAQQSVQAEAQRIDQDLQDDLKFATNAREREAAYRKALDKIAKDLPKGSREQRLAKHQTLVARFDDRNETAQLREQLAEAGIRDPLERARKALADNNADIARMRDAIASGLKSEKDLIPLLIQNKQLKDSVAQAAEAQFQAGQDLAAASYALAVHGDPGAIARHDVAQAQTNLAHAIASGDKTKILEAGAKLKQTKLALWQFMHDEAAAMIQANQAYAEAGIDPYNIVGIANLHVRTDLTDIRRNRANTPSGRRNQDAKLRSDRAEALRARQQSAYQELQFAHDMGRTTDAAYAEQLRALAKTIKHNKGLRRQLLLEAHNLEKAAKDSTDLRDLNVGNIKLPTVYEIRRAMKGGAGPSRQQVRLEQHNRLNVTVASGADVDEVFAAIDGYTSAGLQAAGRSQGVI